jgi:hypothetical protein
MTEQETFSAKQVARRIGTDAKTFRKWLRSTASPYDAVGQGKRYEFPKPELKKIDELFHTWHDKGLNGHPTQKAPTVPVDLDTMAQVQERRVQNNDHKLDDMTDEEIDDYLQEDPTLEELEVLGYDDLDDLDLEDLDEN